MANNAFTPKDAYDAMELGVNQYMLSTDDISLEKVMQTLDLLPSQTRRTADMEKYQQFSSPPSIAYLANWAANVNSNDIVLEPSAGIGGIAVFAKKDGAQVFVNELDKRRLEVIKTLPFDGFFNEDAEQINNIHGDKLEPTVIVMNPPFSSSAERNIHDTKIGAKHIDEALKMLAPNGRLVAIVGQGMADDAPAFRNWWRETKTQYNVKANIGVDGKNYSKYGTTFGVQMLVIDKTGPTIEPVKTAFVENLSDLQSILGGIRSERPSIQHESYSGNEQNPATAARSEIVAEREPEHKPIEPVSYTSGRTDTAVSGDVREPSVTSEVNAAVRGTSDTSPDIASFSDNGLAPFVNTERHGGNVGRSDVDNGSKRQTLPYIAANIFS
jgi:predicted RNA methylase